MVTAVNVNHTITRNCSHFIVISTNKDASCSTTQAKEHKADEDDEFEFYYQPVNQVVLNTVRESTTNNNMSEQVQLTPAIRTVEMHSMSLRPRLKESSPKKNQKKKQK
jgi:hypothetical protein